MRQTERGDDRVVPARPIDPPSPRAGDHLRGREDWQGGPEGAERARPEQAGPEHARPEQAAAEQAGPERREHTGPERVRPESAGRESRQGEESVPTQAMPVPGGERLFDAAAAEDFRDRWRRVQGRFVDDPGAAVEEADKLVVDAMKALAEQKRGLEAWRQGAQTEDLRQSLRRYRAFLDRLLEV